MAIELIRASGRTQGDVALAVIFYGGIAAGVVIISKSSQGTPANLTAYLFGAITTVKASDLVGVRRSSRCWSSSRTWLLRPRLFAVANDEEYARAMGMPVLALNIALAVLTAVTVVVSMRIVGLLLISALMIVPNAAAQLLGSSFRATMRWAVVIGLVCAVGGVVVSYEADTPSGGTIVRPRHRSCSSLASVGRAVVTRVRAQAARAGRDPRPRARSRVRPPGGGPPRTRRLPARRPPARPARGPLRRARPSHDAGGWPRLDARDRGEGGAAVTGRDEPAAPAHPAAGRRGRRARRRRRLHVGPGPARPAARPRAHKVGLATVYRALQTLADQGEVDVLRTDDGESVYRRCSTGAHHHHLVCRSCGRTVEVEGPTVERWADAVSAEHGFRDVTHTLEIFGTCSDCAR